MKSYYRGAEKGWGERRARSVMQPNLLGNDGSCTLAPDLLIVSSVMCTNSHKTLATHCHIHNMTPDSNADLLHIQHSTQLLHTLVMSGSLTGSGSRGRRIKPFLVLVHLNGWLVNTDHISSIRRLVYQLLWLPEAAATDPEGQSIDMWTLENCTKPTSNVVARWWALVDSSGVAWYIQPVQCNLTKTTLPRQPLLTWRRLDSPDTNTTTVFSCTFRFKLLTCCKGSTLHYVRIQQYTAVPFTPTKTSHISLLSALGGFFLSQLSCAKFSHVCLVDGPFACWVKERWNNLKPCILPPSV